MKRPTPEKESFSFLSEIRSAIRKRPGLYFGHRGSKAIPPMIHGAIQGVLRLASPNYKGPVVVSIRRSAITIDFQNFANPLFDPARFKKEILSRPERPPSHPIDSLSPTQKRKLSQYRDTYYILFAAAASNRFEVIQSNQAGKTTVTIDRKRIRTSVTSSRGKKRLSIAFSPDKEIFGRPTHDQFYTIASGFRTLSILHPGLTTALNIEHKQIARYTYERGLESYLFEEDHRRWPIFDDLLHASGKDGDLEFECVIRFVHAGIPQFRTWVNYEPTQGGAHLEAIGQAFRELFGKDYNGCRELPLVVNPDSGKRVLLPHSIIGALHVQCSCPHFQGPTKDVLINQEVFDFVYRTAKRQFGEQWPVLRAKRAI